MQRALEACPLIRGHSPSFNDEVSEFVIAVTGRGGIAFVQGQDQVCGVSPHHKDPYIQHISSCQHHFALAVRVFVGGIFVEGHLGGEAAFLGWNCKVNDTKREMIMSPGTPNNYIFSITTIFFPLKMQREGKADDSKV